jgi:hypothetical protein
MDIFTLLIISWLLVHWFGRGRIGDSVRSLCSGLSCLVMVLSRCCVRLGDTGGLVDDGFGLVSVKQSMY